MRQVSREAANDANWRRHSQRIRLSSPPRGLRCFKVANCYLKDRTRSASEILALWRRQSGWAGGNRGEPDSGATAGLHLIGKPRYFRQAGRGLIGRPCPRAARSTTSNTSTKVTRERESKYED